MMLWGTMPNVKMVISRESLFGKFLTWVFRTPRVPKVHIITQEEHLMLMAKRRLVGKGQCQYCGANALTGVCDDCLEMKR